MRIISVNNINQYNNQSFKGLWSKTDYNVDVDPALGILKLHTISYYFPFKDENPNAARLFVEGNKFARIEDDSCQPRYIVNDCRLCKTLSFTEEEYLQYKSLQNKQPMNEIQRNIHNIAKWLYENDTPSKQKSIFNESV